MMKTPEKVKMTRLLKERMKYEQIGKPRKEAEICSKIARLHIRCGRYKEAIETYKDEVQLWRRLNNSIGEAMCNRSLGECYAEVGLFPMALIHVNQYVSWAESNNNYKELQRALATLGRTYICKAASVDEKGSAEAKASIAKSEDAFLRSMGVIDKHLPRVVSESELSQMRARLYLNLGLVYMHQENYPKSIDSIEKAIKISQDHHKMEDLYRGQLSLGDVYVRMHNTSKSLQALDIAFSISKKLKDKEKECDVLVQRAHIHFTLSEFAAAEAVLRRVCAIGAIKPAEKPNIIEQIKTAKRCTKLERKLKAAMEEVNLKRVMEIHEKLGDCCCKVNIYREALLHYNKQLECALTLGLSAEQMSPIYVSLAATYADSQQYGMAVTMYAKELQLRKGNSKEECKTWLNVADVKEKGGHSYESLQESYDKATKFAVDAKNPKLHRRVLKSLAVVQERYSDAVNLANTRGKLAKLKIEHNLSSDDDIISEEEQTPQAASSDESEAEDFSSLLHGPTVKQEPVVEQLESSQTGTDTESADMINMWLDTDHDELPEGTSLIIKTEPGLETATCSFTSDDSSRAEECSTVIKEEPMSRTLKPQQVTPERWAATNKKGKTLISKVSRPEKRPGSAPVVSQTEGLGPHKKLSQGSPSFTTSPAKTGHSRRKPQHGGRKVIKKFYMGDRNVPRAYVDYEMQGSSGSASPLRLPQQTAAGDVEYSEAENAIEPGPVDHDRQFLRSVSDSGVVVDVSDGHPVSSSSQSNMSVPELNPSEHITGEAERPMLEEKGVSPDSSLPQGHVIEERMPSIAFVHPPRKTTMRVRVTLRGTTHLVNVPLSSVPPASFQWLADRVGARYGASYGVRPNISLLTTDGALISPEDVVSDTLTENEEVIARIDSFTMAHSGDKESPQAAADPTPKGDNTSNPATSAVDTTATPSKPVSSKITSLCQRSLTAICTSYCELVDEDMLQLAEALKNMPSVRKIDLSHSSVTFEGLRGFCQTLFPEGGQSSSFLKILQMFIISHNPLTDGVAPSVASLVQNCPLLADLQLANTQLTPQFFMDHNAVVLQTAFEDALNLKSLDLSQNKIKSEGLHLLLQFLNARVVTTLNLDCITEEGEEAECGISAHLAEYFNQSECALESLSLGGCHLCDGDMAKLSTCIPSTLFWTSLNLSSNRTITNKGLLTLLQGWHSQGCRVRSLDLSNCDLRSPIGQDVTTHLVWLLTPPSAASQSRCCLMTLKLSGNDLQEGDLGLLKAIWALAHGSASSMTVEGNRCVFEASTHGAPDR